jgi:hypothetical protein
MGFSRHTPEQIGNQESVDRFKRQQGTPDAETAADFLERHDREKVLLRAIKQAVDDLQELANRLKRLLKTK